MLCEHIMWLLWQNNTLKTSYMDYCKITIWQLLLSLSVVYSKNITSEIMVM